jgi:hypothetical protein
MEIRQQQQHRAPSCDKSGTIKSISDLRCTSRELHGNERGLNIQLSAESLSVRCKYFTTPMFVFVSERFLLCKRECCAG